MRPLGKFSQLFRTKALLLFVTVAFSPICLAHNGRDNNECKFAVANAIKDLELDKTVEQSGIEEACRFSLKDQRVKGMRTHGATGSDYCTSIISQHWGKREEMKHKISEFCRIRKEALRDHMNKLKTKCGGSSQARGLDNPHVQGLLGLAPCDAACQKGAIDLFTTKIQERCAGKSESDIKEDIQRMKDMVEKSQKEKDIVVSELALLLEDARNLRVVAAQSARNILNVPDQGKAPDGLPTPNLGSGFKPDSEAKAPNGFRADPTWMKRQKSNADTIAGLLVKPGTISDGSSLAKTGEEAKKIRLYDAKVAEQLFVASQLAQAEQSYREAIEKMKQDSAALGEIVQKIQTNNIDGSRSFNPNADPNAPPDAPPPDGDTPPAADITGPTTTTSTSGMDMLGGLAKAGAPIAAAAMASKSEDSQNEAMKAQQEAMSSVNAGNGILNGAKDVNATPTKPSDGTESSKTAKNSGSSPYYSVQQQLADYKNRDYKNTSSASTARTSGNRGVASGGGGGGGSKGSAKDTPKFEKLEPVSEILDANSAMSDELAGGGFGDVGSSFDASPSDPAPSLDDPMKEMVDTMKSALGLGGDKDTGGGFTSGGEDGGMSSENSGNVQASDDTSPEMMDKTLFSRVSDYFNEKCLRKGCVTIGVKEKISF